MVYGIGIELWQWTIPNRFFSVGDAYANAIGAALVIVWDAVEARLRFLPLSALLGTTDPDR